jgi:hypothetical protein
MQYDPPTQEHDESCIYYILLHCCDQSYKLTRPYMLHNTVTTIQCGSSMRITRILMCSIMPSSSNKLHLCGASLELPVVSLHN